MSVSLNSTDKRREPPVARAISYGILFLLLIIRFADLPLRILVFTGRPSDRLLAVYLAAVYVLMTTLIWLNRKVLEALHVEISFIGIYIASGLLLILLDLPLSLGIPVGIAVGSVYWAYRSGRLEMGEPLRIRASTIGWILAGVLPILPTFFYILSSQMKVHLGAQSLLLALYNANLPLVVFEEFLFRGMLWKLLRDMRLADPVIIVIQALAFWLAHYDILLSRHYFEFWIGLPALGLILGVIVLKTKSLTPSTVSHYLLNCLVEIAKTAL